MAEIKTKPTDASISKFIDTVNDETKRMDSYKIIEIMKDITKEEPKMWGASIIGFGTYHYKYESGRESDICLVGFSPRKNALTLYTLAGSPEQDELLKKLGKHKTGKGCLYVNKLEDIDINVLKKLIRGSITHLKKKEAKTK